MKKYISLLIIALALPAQAALFNQEEIASEFGGHDSFNEIVSLNNSLSSQDIKICPSVGLLEKCYKWRVAKSTLFSLIA
jgi:hypothetical protein